MGAHVGIGETVTWNRSDPLERSTAEDGKRESKRANQAVRDYLLMGPARSLRKLLASYQGDENAPTHSWAQLSFLSVKFDWVARSEQFDKLQQDKARAEYEARRVEIMSTGLALEHERVEVLKRLHEKLNGYLSDENLVWLRDTKAIRTGSHIEVGENGKMAVAGDYQVIDTITFNAALIGKVLETVDALAAETGGRVRKTELTGKNGGPIRTADSPVNLGLLSDEELEEYEKLTEKAAGDASSNAGRSAG